MVPRMTMPPDRGWTKGVDLEAGREIDGTLWLCQNSFGKWPFIVDIPINKWWIFPQLCERDYQRVPFPQAK